jgi:hypothetical protein
MPIGKNFTSVLEIRTVQSDLNRVASDLFTA